MNTSPISHLQIWGFLSRPLRDNHQAAQPTRKLEVGANYRAACGGRSKDKFSAKLGIALEEVDE